MVYILIESFAGGGETFKRVIRGEKEERRAFKQGWWPRDNQHHLAAVGGHHTGGLGQREHSGEVHPRTSHQ